MSIVSGGLAKTWMWKLQGFCCSYAGTILNTKVQNPICMMRRGWSWSVPGLKQQLCPSVHPIDGINGQFWWALRAVIRSNPQSRQSLMLQSRIISLLSQMLFPADAMRAALESSYLFLLSVGFTNTENVHTLKQRIPDHHRFTSQRHMCHIVS